MRLRTLRTATIPSGTRVVLRLDLNLPMQGGKIADAWRLTKTLPTIVRLQRAGARVVILSHFGRPDGTRVKHDSLAPLARALSQHLGRPVAFAADCIGPAARRAVAAVRPGEAVLLENLRFHREEEKNSLPFAKALAGHGELFVNDAFAAAHRAHASIVGIPRFLPSLAGLLMEDEVTHLARLLVRPKRPYVVLMGGAKIETKVGLIRAMGKVADEILLGGLLAVPVLAARGLPIGRTKIGAAEVAVAKRLRLPHLRLPLDVVVASSAQGKPQVRAVAEVGPRDIIFDIGPATIRLFASRIRRAKTLVWNGPMGLFERPAFSHGTRALGRYVATRASGPAYGLAGGGETVQALDATGMSSYMDWVSTGGGAMLDFLEKGTLPGLRPLVRK